MGRSKALLFLAFVLMTAVAVVWGTAGPDSGRAEPPPPFVSGTPSVPQATPPSRGIDRSDLASALRAASDLGGPKNPKLASHLVRLAAVERRERASGRGVTASDLSALPGDLRALLSAGFMRIDDQGRVQVYVVAAADPALTRADLGAASAQVERSDDAHGLIQARLPIRMLEAVAALPSVRFVRLPDYGFTQAGVVTSQGDGILRADEVRSTFGVDGTGVRVGVISDGVQGLAPSQSACKDSSCELPAVDIATCNVVPQSPTSSGAGAEGTAMLEIVHDLAPGADLLFGHFGLGFSGTSLDFNDAVNCLAANADVVVDDIGFLNAGPYDGSSNVSQNTAAALNGSGPIRAYANAVGNQALQHYEEPYVDCSAADPGCSDYHLFSSTADTVDVFAIGPDVIDPFYLLNNMTACVFLQWNDPWSGSSNDFDLYLFDDDSAKLVALSEGPQTGTQRPDEALCYTNDGPEGYFDIVIFNFDAPQAKIFDMFVFFPTGCAPLGSPTGPCHNFNTQGSSVPNNADAGGSPVPIISLGAINASDLGHNDIANYSSRGPTNDHRIKPDGAAIDGVSVTGNGGFSPTFFGSSAAAPHAGAVAALILECNPALLVDDGKDDPAAERGSVRNLLLKTAVDLGAPGTDNTFGYGRIVAVAAASAAGCADGDGDGLRDGHESSIGTNPASPDTDGDGCLDGRELSPDETLGGRRDPTFNPLSIANSGVPGGQWDFYDVNGDQIVDLQDILELVGRFDQRKGISPAYDASYDRGPPIATAKNPSPDGWDLGPPDGVIDLMDILSSIAQFDHRCN